MILAKKNVLIIPLIIIVSMHGFTLLQGFDLAQYYRANFFYGQPLTVNSEWETLTSIRIGGGSGEDEFGPHKGHKRSVLNSFGCANINRIGYNVETEDPCLYPSLIKPVTQEFLSKGGIIPSFDFICGDGTLSFCGKFKTLEVDIDWWQNLCWGFFLYAYLPIKRLEVTNISYHNNTRPESPHADEFQDFLTNDFNAALAENCLFPVCTPFCKTSVGDPALFLGWHGYKEMPKNFLSDINGLVEIGVTFPVTNLRNQQIVFSVPAGYEEHWSIGFRLQLEAGVKNWFALGFTGGAYVFLAKKNCLRLYTDCAQSGPIVFQKAHVDVDPRELWDVGGYIKADRFLKGISVLLGYSYTKHEKTRVDVQDCTFLSTLIAEEAAYGLCNVPYRTNQNQIANRTQQLEEWDRHVLHFMFELDLDYLFKTQFAPLVTIAYDYPFTGKNSWKVPMVSGSLGLHIKWDM